MEKKALRVVNLTAKDIVAMDNNDPSRTTLLPTEIGWGSERAPQPPTSTPYVITISHEPYEHISIPVWKQENPWIPNIEMFYKRYADSYRHVLCIVTPHTASAVEEDFADIPNLTIATGIFERGVLVGLTPLNDPYESL